MPLALLLLLTLAIPPQTQPVAPPKDALALLNEVSQRYADAKSYHIEAVEERTSTNELSRSWQKEFMTAIVMADGRYRYEGHSGVGTVIYVSDGIHAWDYLPDEKVYTERPAANEDKQRVHVPEEITALNAKSMASVLARRADVLKSATFLPDEAISIAGKNADCYVVRGDFKVQHAGLSRELTIWIDKSRRVIVKTLEREQPLSTGVVNGHIQSTTESTITYTGVELNRENPASSFTFVAPGDAKLVVAFSSPYASGPRPEWVGRTASELRFKSADGTVITLSSLRGKPVFLDFWASWCGPCKGLIPDLLKLYNETSPKGVVWMGIDNDENPDAAAKFMNQNHIPWPNYHDLDGSMGAAFQRNVIPLGVLIDARGNIAFYQTGYQAAELRTAIPKLGPEFGSVAPAGVNAAGVNSK